MSARTKREAALKLLASTGMWRSSYVPPLLRLLWRLGLDVPRGLLTAPARQHRVKYRLLHIQRANPDTENARQRLASSPDIRTDDNYALHSPDPSGNPGAVGAPRFDLKPSSDGTTTTVAVVPSRLTV